LCDADGHTESSSCKGFNRLIVDRNTNTYLYRYIYRRALKLLTVTVHSRAMPTATSRDLSRKRVNRHIVDRHTHINLKSIYT